MCEVKMREFFTELSGGKTPYDSLTSLVRDLS